MTVSPTWGFRTSLGTYIFLTITYLLIIDKFIKENKIINYILTFILIISSIFYITLYSSVRLQLNENNKNIKKHKHDAKCKTNNSLSSQRF